MQSKEKMIVWFDTPKKPELSHVGGKCLGLYKLGLCRVHVPPWFCVNTNAYRRFLKARGLEGVLSKYENELAGGKDINTVTSKIRKAVVSARLPRELSNAVAGSYAKLCDISHESKLKVSVRSSATIEDLSAASFAGMFKTRLGVSGANNVASAMKECWSSLFLDRVLSYMKAKGTLPKHIAKLSMAVIVQKMVDSDVSGIIFTVDPRSAENADSLIIESSYGLGEPIVSSRVTPDTYAIDRNLLTLTEKRIGTKKVYQKLGTDTEKAVDTPARLASTYSLSDREAVEIAKSALKIEQHFGSPQDIEFAVERGKVFFLQSRPITTLKS